MYSGANPRGTTAPQSIGLGGGQFGSFCEPVQQLSFVSFQKGQTKKTDNVKIVKALQKTSFVKFVKKN